MRYRDVFTPYTIFEAYSTPEIGNKSHIEEIDMSHLTEEQRIKKIIKVFKNKYPRAVALKKDKNLIGKILEDLTHQAFSQNGLKVVNWAVSDGDRGIDITVMVDCFTRPLFLAVECMNGKYDYTPIYLGRLKKRLAKAYSKQQFPLIICVDKKVNFKRLTRKFAFNVEFIELGKQFHPNTTTYTDYERLKKQVWDTINKIVLAERPEEMAETQELEEEKKALEDIDDKKLKKHENSEDEKDCQNEEITISWDENE